MARQVSPVSTGLKLPRYGLLLSISRCRGAWGERTMRQAKSTADHSSPATASADNFPPASAPALECHRGNGARVHRLYTEQQLAPSSGSACAQSCRWRRCAIPPYGTIANLFISARRCRGMAAQPRARLLRKQRATTPRRQPLITSGVTRGDEKRSAIFRDGPSGADCAPATVRGGDADQGLLWLSNLSTLAAALSPIAVLRIAEVRRIARHNVRAPSPALGGRSR